ncbi:MAG: hypothetical protein AAFY17_06935 [Cyanobacteria bacterium J06642_11]
MERVIVVGLTGINLVCLSLLWCSIWPGLVMDILVWVYLAMMLLALPVALVVVFILWQRHHLLQFVSPQLKKLALITVAIALGSHILIKAEIPRKAAFALSRPAFEKALAEAPARNFSEEKLDRFLGIYWVPYYGASRTGGVYFMTGRHGLIFPDTYGIAYRPNAYGTPFGSDRYEYHPLSQDWYWFKAGFNW